MPTSTQTRAIMSKRKSRIRPADDAKSYILSMRDKPAFMERYIDTNKGRGVFAKESIEPGDFVLEYRGELLSLEECHSRRYSETESTFVFEFEWQKRCWCIDASKEDGSLGRLVNDNHKTPNSIMRKIIVNESPHLCLFAIKKIEIGSEIEYNYGYSKWPWREKVTSSQAPATAVETKTFPVDRTLPESSNKGDASTQVTRSQAPAAAVETETFPIDLTLPEGSNKGDASTQVMSSQAPAAAVETETFPIDLTLPEGSNKGDASTQVMSSQAPAAAVETETFPIDLTLPEGSNKGDASSQVTSSQAPAAAVETETFPIDLTLPEGSNKGDASTQVTSSQAPAAAVETETFPIYLTLPEGSNKGDASTQVTSSQAPAAAMETETFPIDLTLPEGSNKGDASTQVMSSQAPAAAVETETFPIDLTLPEGSNKGDASSQVTSSQAPAAAMETETFPIDLTLPEDSNKGDASTQVMSSQAPAAAVETETFPIDLTLPEGSNKGDASSQVTSSQAPAAAMETETFPIYLTLPEGSNKGDASTQVMSSQAPAAAVETETFPIDLTLPEGSNKGDASSQVTSSQAPATAVETETFPIDLTLPEGSNKGDASTQVTSSQAPAAAVETETFPIYLTLPEGSNKGDASTQVTSSLAPAAAMETETFPIDLTLPEGSNKGDASTQVMNKQAPAAPVETNMFPIDITSNKESTRGGASTQVFNVRSFSLVDYSDSDESEGDSLKDPHLTRCDVPNKSTENILMDKVLSFSDSLYDLSDDSTNGPSITESVMAPQRPSRECCHPIPNNLFGSDDSSISSEEEYVPKQDEESTESDLSTELPLEGPAEKKIASKNRRRGKSSHPSHFESGQERKFEIPKKVRKKSELPKESFPDSTEVNENTIGQTKAIMESSSLEEEPAVYVDPVLKGVDGSRQYNKRHCCLYCGKKFQKMSRHLSRKHKEKVDVAKALSFPKNSKERRQQLNYIRNKGNFEHNTEVLESKKGTLIPWKQPKSKTEGNDYLHCLYCYGLFTKRVMWRHFKFCMFKPEGKTKPGKTRVQALCAFAEPAPIEYSTAYWKFLSCMNQDKITLCIKGDRCILDYGFRLFNKNETVYSQHQYLRQKLRELGRLMLEVKKITSVKTIRELVKPENYGSVVCAARGLAGFSRETGKYKRPSLARKVGHNLHSLSLFIKSEGLKRKDKQTAQDAEEFAQLYKESWKFDIASQAVTQLDQVKWNSPQLLPFTKDVQTLHCHLSEKQQQHLNAIKQKPSPISWKELAKVTLVQIILFNRRRAGEVSRMPLSAYLSKDTSETHEDVTLALTALEQKLCKHFVRIAIVGKRGRKVPVLLTPLMRESLDTLTEKREECGVLNENGYLFALPHSEYYLRGSDCMRQLVNECDNLKTPKALTSTKLRKHIATLSTVLNLKTTELDQLADFLGHNIDVHRKHYRLPEGTLQLAKISKVLLALEQGRLGEYKGKSLDEIDLDANETVYMEGCSQEDIEDSQENIEDCRRSETHNSEDDASVTSLIELPSTSFNPKKGKSASKRGTITAVKRSWTPDEIAAVEKHLKKFIVRHQVPGKIDCEHCISAEPEALGNRDWKGVKYFVKNRICTMRRKVDQQEQNTEK